MTSVAATRNFRLVAGVVASALFMQNVDGTIVATALPGMGRDLHVSAVSLSATITAYLVALTVFIPVSGYIADRFGAKRVFMAAMATFTLASIACALSTGLAALLIARVVQGVGGAMMVPVGRLILFRSVKREELLSATTWLTMPALIGPVLGPPIGGFLTDAFSWQSVFWVNVPMGVAGLVLIWWIIPATEEAVPPAPDLTGMTLIGVALTLLMIGVETTGRGVLAAWLPPVLVIAGVLSLILTVRHCRRRVAAGRHAAVDFALLDIPTFHVSNVAGSLFRAGAGALPFLLPLALQLGFGMSASKSGLISLASSLGSLCMRPMTVLALRYWSMRSVLISGSVAFGAVLLVCAAFSAAHNAWPNSVIFAILLLGGLSRSLSFASMGALTFADVPQAQLSAATSFQGTAQQLMKAVGVAFAAGAIQVGIAVQGHSHAERNDFAFAFVAVALLVLASAPMFMRMSATAGAGISGEGKKVAK